ncbi:MAG TPA: hypothetical protein VH639_19605 [Bryobacteraceae bacterium]|jgi:hypothetical protein
MRRTVTFLLVVGTAAAAFSDTVTTTDHLSVNGSLKQMANGVIALDAVFSSGTKTLSIQMSAVDNIGFNATTFNPGAPPTVLRIGPSKGAAPRGEAASDVIVLRGGQRRDCRLLSIDADTVHCAGNAGAKGKEKGGDYNRRTVLRILVGAR